MLPLLLHLSRNQVSFLVIVKNPAILGLNKNGWKTSFLLGNGNSDSWKVNLNPVLPLNQKATL
jgi:hypothetical protein